MRNLYLCLLLVALPRVLPAKVVTYAVPDALHQGKTFVNSSKEYQIEISQDGQSQNLFVYNMEATHVTNNSKTTAWVNFSFSGSIQVKVTKLKGGIDFCQVLPRSAGIVPQKKGKSISFQLHQPGHYSIEFEQGIRIEHPLLLFANPLEQNAPKPENPEVIFFGPGLHDIGEKYLVPAGKTVYLDGGAYVRGQFYTENIDSVVIRGRGILSGEAYSARTAEHMITLRNARNVEIEGITIVHASRYMIALSGQRHWIHQVKMMGWWFSTDGVSAGEHALIEDCFFKVNDDAIKLYSSYTVARNNVIWQMENGAAFMISWNGSKDFGHCQVSNIEIIRVEHEWDNENLAVVCAVHGGKANIQDFTFENITIDNSNWRIFHLVTRPNRWGKWDPEQGSLGTMTFRNFIYYGVPGIKNLIAGHDLQHPVFDLHFENIQIKGQQQSNFNDHFIIDEETTREITIH